MLAALLLFAQAQDAIQLGSVDVGGRLTAVTVPSLRGPFGPNSSHVTIDGWNFEVKPDMNLGIRYKSDGGWGEVADAYPAAAARAASAPEYRIKVLVLDYTSIAEEGRDGIWRERNGILSPQMTDEIYASLARMKALAETAADGRVRITFDVTVDSDLVFGVARPGETHRPTFGVQRITAEERPADSGLLGPRFVYDEIGPRINNDLFEAEDGRYRGPYSSVFVVHAMKTPDASTYLLDRTPLSSFSYATFTDRDAGTTLSIQLFYAWLQHLGLAAQASMKDSAFHAGLPTGDALPKVPHVFDTPITTAMLENGNRFRSPGFGDGTPRKDWGSVAFSLDDAKAMNIEELPVVEEGQIPGASKKIGSLQALVGTIGGDRNYVAVHPAVLAQYMAEHPNEKPAARTSNPSGGWDRVLFPAQREPENDLRELGLQLGSFPAMRMIGQGPVVGKVAFSPSRVGDFAATTETDPTVGQIVVVQEDKEDRRGYVVLASSDGGDALMTVESSTGLSFKASCDLVDSYVLRLVTRKGRTVDVLLYGSAPVPAEVESSVTVIDARKRPAPAWVDFNVPIGNVLSGEEIVEVRLAPPMYAACYPRMSIGTKSLKIGQISFGAVSETLQPTQPEANADVAWLMSIKSPQKDASLLRVRNLLDSDDLSVRMNALAMLSQVKQPEVIQEIGILARSGFVGEAYLAVEALKFQDVDQAWSQVAFAALDGPFAANYRFAAEALQAKKEDVTLNVLSGPLLSQSWHARLFAVKTFNTIDTENSAILASATLGGGEPSPAVRFALVSQSRPKSELFCRRVLYAAVNDESEWVRMRGYLSLLDAEPEAIREEAIKGVRDVSVSVRLALLNAMARNPKAEYRTALHVAVVDREAVVRAAALKAFAKQPGPVQLAEVQNTLDDKSSLVQSALKELAEAKGLQIPPRP